MYNAVWYEGFKKKKTSFFRYYWEETKMEEIGIFETLSGYDS